MAEIPVERKGGIPWWVWLLLLLLAAVLVWFMLVDDNDTDVIENDVAVEQVEPIDTVDTMDMADTGPITTMDALMAAPLATMVGREVSFDSIPVESVTGDMAFYVGENEANRTYVVFDEVRTPNMVKEGKVDVNPGSLVKINGRIMSANDAMPSGITAKVPTGTDAYIFADTIDVVK